MTLLLRATLRGLFALLVVALVACGASPQTPGDYLVNALDWVEAHAVLHDRVADWPALRAEALAQVPNPASVAETYPAIRHVLAALNASGDRNAYLLDPGILGVGVRSFGSHEIRGDGTIVFLEPGGPAERAGLRVGDRITHVDGVPHAEYAEASANLPLPQSARFTVVRPGEASPREVTLESAQISYEGRPSGRRIVVGGAGVSYLELPWDWGSRRYPTLAQEVIRAADQPAACGWIVDLRRNVGGDMWTFLAAVGPILGPGELGGFVYRDGRREGWSYQDGEVRWNGERRGESEVEGAVYTMAPRPVALLMSPATVQAGESTLIAFLGRPETRLFGEPTEGVPFLVDHTTLSDGAELFVSGARSYDRTGAIYEGPIAPDERVATDWTRFGGDDDPVIHAALAWLRAQPACSR
ncbi:MAG: PDZ domain-containing protein [Chloroflexales bacterium]|nr:PDZ domain-containing protein [Chloroflexales bacterium]